MCLQSPAHRFPYAHLLRQFNKLLNNYYDKIVHGAFGLIHSTFKFSLAKKFQTPRTDAFLSHLNGHSVNFAVIRALLANLSRSDFIRV